MIIIFRTYTTSLFNFILTFQSGPYNKSGVWKGVMGDVLTGKYQLSLSAWNWLIERDSFLDFVPIVKDFQIMAVVPSPPKVDPGNNSF